ncbi:MAG: N-6 DNA methylase [Candidatus Methanomethyliales bacterium]|nr:N-6 DNA methylase [Candidatus Methanomethylicales archaeon]
MLERNIQVELYRVLQNLIAKKFSYNDIEFVGVRFEPTINGRPDLVVEAIEKGKKISLLVIETKRKVPFIDRKFDPYSIDVIRQASNYAVELGAPYFATCNGEVFVLFDTFTAGVPLPQRRLKHYKVSFDEEFAKTLLEEVCRFRIGVGKWLELDDVFLQRLRTFHNFITPFILESLTHKLNEDLGFKEKYISWLKSQLFEYSPEMNERIAEQLAYMLMNRLTFYKTLEAQILTIPKLKKIETEDPNVFSQKLSEYFSRVSKEVDYEAIFEHHPILDEIPFSKKLMYALEEFIEELGTYNLAKIRSDIIGRVYEELIPDFERHRLGQYYTPPPIVELITEMCIKSPKDKVLDPACGSGSFLVKAYHKLKDLKKKENPFADENRLHEEILSQLYGIDINPFPAQLSSINLAIRNLKVPSKHINLIVSDFFKVKPSDDIIPLVDVVVTNPPYTRQEEMEYKDKIREEALTYSDGSKIDISAQAGIYTYFFTHSAKFLKNHGMMGQITSDTWLDVGYGEGVKRFFLDHFKIHAIIWYDVRAFERALVGTCITILEKEDESKEAKENNTVKFVRIKQPIPIQEIVRIIETAKEDFENERVGITLKKQKELKPEEKWGLFLRSPIIYFKLKQHPKMVKLGEIAEIRRGFTTGADEFFYLDKEKVKLWGIEDKYLKPVVTSPQNIGVEIKSDDINQWVFMVHIDKEDLKKEDAKALKYIEHGENIEIRIRGGRRGGSLVKGYNNLSTLISRKRWYDLGERKPAPILFARKMWEQCVYSLNKANAYAHQCFYEVHPNSKENIIVLAGLLNSSVTAFLSELHGRFYGGGVLELTVYESKNLPVLNPEKLSKEERKKIEVAFLKICEAQNKGDEKLEQEARRELDNAVFDVLGLSETERKQVYEGLESLRRMRLQRKEVDILVETAEKWKPIKKTKKERLKHAEPSKRLDSWMIG